jgi:hypothetical protein
MRANRRQVDARPKILTNCIRVERFGRRAEPETDAGRSGPRVRKTRERQASAKSHREPGENQITSADARA